MLLTLDSIAERLPQVTRYDGYIAGLCPFHDDHRPSLLVYDKDPTAREGWFRCLACGEQGTWSRLYDALGGVALQTVGTGASSYGLPIVPKTKEGQEHLALNAHEAVMKNRAMRWYWELRGVEERIESDLLGYWDGWATIPVYNRYGDFDALVLRAGRHIQEETGLRYLSPGTPTLFVPDWPLFLRARSVFIVYGMIDALALAVLRLPVATPTSGKDSFKPEWLSDLPARVCFVPDQGEEETALKHANAIGGRGRLVTLSYPGELADPADYLSSGKKDLLLRELAKWV